MDISSKDIKSIVKAIRSELKDNPKHSHNSILGAIANGLGFKNWESLESTLIQTEAAIDTKEAKSTTPEFWPAHYLYSFGYPKAGQALQAFNGRTLKRIVGSMEMIPGCAIISDFEYAEEPSELKVNYADETEVAWDSTVTQKSPDGQTIYVDEDDIKVLASNLVFAAATSKEALEAMPHRSELLGEYWNQIDKRMNALEFLAWPNENKRKFIEDVLTPAIGFMLTENEIQSILTNQVYGDTLIHDWFKLMPNPSTGSEDLFSGFMYETYGNDLKAVKAMMEKDPSRVWTYLECDGVWVIASGYHHVNRMNYFISEIGLPENIGDLSFLDECVDAYTFQDEEDDEDEFEGNDED